MKHKLFPLPVFIALIFLVTSAFSQGLLGPDNYKYETSKKIYDRIGNIAKDDRMAPPFVLISKGLSGGNLAWYDPRVKAIYMQEEIYDLCMGLGEDSLSALAFILGHELSHYFDKHDFMLEFGDAYYDLPIGKQVTGDQLGTIIEGLKGLSETSKIELATTIAIRDHVEHEAQADHDGAFHSFIAGYNSITVAPKVFDALYGFLIASVHENRNNEDFQQKLANVSPSSAKQIANLSDEQLMDSLSIAGGYPSKHDRKEIVTRLDTAFKLLRPIWEAATRLIMTANYEEASRCYEYIAAHGYPSREIYNNAGAAKLLWAISLLKTTMKFVYPVLLDLQSGLAKSPKGFGLTPPNVGQILSEAQADFDQAIGRDKTYATARVNLSCTLDLLKELDEAKIEADRAVLDATKYEPNILVNARIAQAIIAAHQGNTDEAKSAFLSLKDKSPIAAENFDRMNGKINNNLGIASTGTEKPSIRDEFIAGITPTSWIHNLSDDQALHITADSVEMFTQTTDRYSGIKIRTRGKNLSLISTLPHSKEETGRNIRLGASLNDVRSKYGDPKLTLQTGSGTYLAYGDAQIISTLMPITKSADGHCTNNSLLLSNETLHLVI